MTNYTPTYVRWLRRTSERQKGALERIVDLSRRWLDSESEPRRLAINRTAREALLPEVEQAED